MSFTLAHLLIILTTQVCKALLGCFKGHGQDFGQHFFFHSLCLIKAYLLKVNENLCVSYRVIRNSKIHSS